MSAVATRPNLLVPGATKAGTTSLYWWLDQHPAIATSSGKELNAFAPLRFADVRRAPDLEGYDRATADMAGSPWRLESSPQDLYGGAEMVAALRAAHPEDLRVVLVLRDPAARLWSDYRYKLQLATIDPNWSFTTFLDACLAAEADGTIHDQRNREYATFAVGRYATHLVPWLEGFGDRLRVVVFEEAVADPAATVADVVQWLGLDAEPLAGSHFGQHNQTAVPRSRVVARAVDLVRPVLASFLRRNPRAADGLRSLYQRVNAADEAPAATGKEAAIARACEVYDPETARLTEVLGQHGHDVRPPWVAAARERLMA